MTGGRRDGAQLLEDLGSALTRYVVLPSEETKVASTLWIAATHAQTVWESAPRLTIKSPEKRCGKSRLLDVIEATSCRPFVTFNATVAAVVRSIKEDKPVTLLVDEADAIWSRQKTSEGAEDLRALLNAGFGRGRPVVRCVGPLQTPTPFPSFSMAALAGIGDTIPDTITDRSVVVRMRRRAPGESVAPFRQRRDGQPLKQLGASVGAWLGGALPQLSRMQPDMPIEDRAADVWEPLVCVADLAGGQWPELARQAAKVTTDLAEEDETDQSVSMRLLTDLRDVFDGHHGLERADRLHAMTLVSTLTSIEDSPWPGYKGRGLSVADLSSLLKQFGPRAAQLKIGGVNRNGYSRDQFNDPWRRYLHDDQQGGKRP